MFSRSFLLAMLGLAAAARVAAASDGDGMAFFEKRIRPVLVEQCYECHSVKAGKAKGGLQVDTREGLRLGGDSGAAVVAGDPAHSLLLTAISHADPDLAMPPKKPKLGTGVIADFEAWIRSGAVDPREKEAAVASTGTVDMEAGRKFWSNQKPLAGAMPEVRRAGWATRPLDRFVLARLEESHLDPSPDAAPAVWLRRVHYDVTGLPPSPEETAAFVQGWKSAVAESTAKLEEHLAVTVDRLLASARFGERWGRHWLDVARFAESNGRESNLAFPHAWRYRDYVIDAVNADVRYDRFLTEQLAGDLLPARDDAERARLLVATGFLALGAKGLNEMSKAQFAADLVDEQVDTVTRALLASSVACARCHDHKTDPFRMEDYYALAGVFRSTRTFYGTWVDSENNNGGELMRLPEVPGQLIPNKGLRPEEVLKLKADLAALDRKEKEQEEYVKKAQAEGRDISKDYFKLLQTAIGIYWSRGGIEGRLQTVDENGNALPLSMGVREAGQMQNAPLLERGETAHPGRLVPRAFPAVFQVAGAAGPPVDQSGRLELAQWLTHRDHPLTARVMVNRVWRQVFGTGLVRTVDNFGVTGEAPSHPELLDYLAVQFMERGWSVKALVRELVLSRTYRQSAQYREAAFTQDPDNRLLWRMRPRRMDAEAMRDAMLAIAGTLDVSRRPGSLVAELDGQSVSLIGFNEKVPADLDGSHRRSVYLPVLRDQLPDALQLFDFAEPSLVTGDRDVTNTSLQALYLMNGRFVQEQSRALAERLVREVPGDDAAERVRRAFRLCYNREPDETEMKLAGEFLRGFKGEGAWAAFCQSLFAAAEFRVVE